MADKAPSTRLPLKVIHQSVQHVIKSFQAVQRWLAAFATEHGMKKQVVILATYQKEVFRTIIQAISIYVMDMLMSLQLSPNKCSHHMPMFEDWFAINPDLTSPVGNCPTPSRCSESFGDHGSAVAGSQVMHVTKAHSFFTTFTPKDAANRAILWLCSILLSKFCIPKMSTADNRSATASGVNCDICTSRNWATMLLASLVVGHTQHTTLITFTSQYAR